MNFLQLSISLVLLVTLSCACTPLSQRQESDQYKKISDKLQQQSRQAMVKARAAKGYHYKDKTWIGGGERVSRQVSYPAVFYQTHKLNDLRPLSLKQVMERINLISPYPIHMASEVVKLSQEGTKKVKQEISGNGKAYHPSLVEGGQIVNFNGTLKSLLDLVTSTHGIYWRFENSRILFYQYLTRTFPIRSLPTVVKLNNELSNNGGNGGSSSTSKQSTAITLEDAKLWEYLEEAIELVLSENGKAKVIPTANRVTVIDVPEAIERVEKLVRNYNDGLARQVMIEVEIVDLSLFDNFSKGINWDLLHTSASDSLYKFTGLLPKPSPNNGGLFSISVPEDVDKKYSGSQAVLEALREQGIVSYHARSAVIALNNRPSPISIGNTQNYLERVEVTTAVNAGTSTSLTPGTLNTGFSLNVLPSILDGGKIFLQYSLDITSQNGDLKEFSAGNNTIQLPNVNRRSFVNSLSIRSGDIIVLPGYEENLWSEDQGGGLGGVRKRYNKKNSKILLILSATSLKV